MPSWGLPAPLRGRRPGGSPAPRGPQQDARRPGGAAARRAPGYRPRPPAAPGRRTVPAARIGERAPARPLSRPLRHFSPVGTMVLGPTFYTHLSAPAPPPPAGRCLERPALASAARAPAPCREPRWALPLRLLHTLTLPGSPRLSVLLGRFLSVPFRLISFLLLSCLYPSVPTRTLFLPLPSPLTSIRPFSFTLSAPCPPTLT